MAGPEEQAEMAAVQAAVARGLIGGQELREALLLKDELARQGQPCPILHLLRARWLPPESLPWLREVHRRALRQAQGGRADSDRLASHWDSVPLAFAPGVLNLGAELARRDPAQDPAAVQEFLAASLARRSGSDRLPSGNGRSGQVTWHDPLAGKSAPSSSDALTLPRGSDRLARVEQRVSRYEVVRELARGGMGVVYVARDPELEREVALKVLKPFEEEQGDEIERFKREARAMARLSHPNVVAIHDAGCEGRTPFLVMELVKGESLKERIKRQGVLDPGEAARIGAKVARALHHAHEAGILHRDVKPANVLVREDGEPLLVDFGLARSVGPSASLTRPGEVLGTPLYMAPEQASGELDLVDARTDVYALGTTLYHAVTGRTPFQGPDPLAVMASIVVEEPGSIVAQLPDFDPALERIVLACLRKERRDRPQTGLALAEELEAWSRGDRRATPARGAPAAPLIAAALLVVGVSAASLLLVAGRGEVARAPAPSAALTRPVTPPAVDPAPDPFHLALEAGMAANLRGDWAAAREPLERAVALEPRDPRALAQLGWTLLELVRPEAALAVLDRALALDPHQGLARTKRGTARGALGRWGDAREDFEAAVELDAGDPANHYHLALALQWLRHPPEKVLERLDRALERKPEGFLAGKIHYMRAALLEPVDAAAARIEADLALELAEPGSDVALEARKLVERLRGG